MFCAHIKANSDYFRVNIKYEKYFTTLCFYTLKNVGKKESRECDITRCAKYVKLHSDLARKLF